ncbi:MAG: hypothetical protein P4L76_17985 [Beijerinckiaceae bacterium]|nr:hypothetical protein [Beijerinckiaceae bacterium]
MFWPFGRNAGGYGVTTFRGTLMTASRAMCFMTHGDPPTGEHEAAHECGRGHLGCIAPNHLSWKTPTQNQLDRRVHGTALFGEAVSSSKLTAEDVVEIRRRLGTDPSTLGAEFAVSPSTIRDVIAKRTWRHLL